MRVTPLVHQLSWSYRTVEWSPKLLTVHSEISASHFVFPDLPNVHEYSDQERKNYFNAIPPSQRIQTIAACNHDEKSLGQLVIEAGKLLVVGGHDKNCLLDNKKNSNSNANKKGSSSCCALSTTDAVQILRQRDDTKTKEIWGVANPNNINSIESVNEKIAAGITGFITQPLLSSHALDIMKAYPREANAAYIAGVAMPSSNKSLKFWSKLLEQPELETDALFKSHMAFFQNPYFSSMAWIIREVQNLEAYATIDGIHFMPMKNTNDLLDLLRK